MLHLKCFFDKFSPKIEYFLNSEKINDRLLSNIFLKRFIVPFIVFGGKFGPKNLYSPSWLKLNTGAYCDMLLTILIFIFHFFSIIFWSKFCPKIGYYPHQLVHCYIPITIFFDKFCPKFWCSQNWLEFTKGLIVICWLNLSIILKENLLQFHVKTTF